jgi:hypothetical protein
MELMAAIQGLLALKEPVELEITTRAMKITTAAIGWPRMPLGRRPVPGPMAGRMTSFVSTWDGTMSRQGRRLVSLTMLRITRVTPA